MAHTCRAPHLSRSYLPQPKHWLLGVYASCTLSSLPSTVITPVRTAGCSLELQGLSYGVAGRGAGDGEYVCVCMCVCLCARA